MEISGKSGIFLEKVDFLSVSERSWDGLTWSRILLFDCKSVDLVFGKSGYFFEKKSGFLSVSLRTQDGLTGLELKEYAEFD